MDFNEYEVIAEDTNIYWNAEIRGEKLIIRIARKDKFEEWDYDFTEEKDGDGCTFVLLAILLISLGIGLAKLIYFIFLS